MQRTAPGLNDNRLVRSALFLVAVGGIEADDEVDCANPRVLPARNFNATLVADFA
jgi:hypothetical protein